jgi:hypothetical protein
MGWFGVAAFIYAIVAIVRCALYDVDLDALSPKKKRYEALAHLLIWTFVPPLWFAFEATVLHPLPPGTTDLSLGQKLAAGIWAAVFAVILVLVKP